MLHHIDIACVSPDAVGMTDAVSAWWMMSGGVAPDPFAERISVGSLQTVAISRPVHDNVFRKR